MSIRDRLKKREEKREMAANGGLNGGLPEGVTRYVTLSRELKGDGKPFVLLRDPDLWYFYFVHEDREWGGDIFIRKHTCLNSPRKAPETIEEADALFDQFEKPNPEVCISDKAGAKRNLYFMVPVYDPEYDTWRVLDLKEFHATNIIGDLDKVEKGARKFDKNYTLVGNVCVIKKTSDGKSYTLDSYDGDDEESIVGKAESFLSESIPYEELANFREESDIVKILHEASGDRVDKSVLPPLEMDETESSDTTEHTTEEEDPTKQF
ncbi:DNA binding protein [Bacillus phage Mgbh1]|uniref:Single-stranded DNA binding-like protein n=1 Tax=Bacillus phage Mgbh1 TaxID=1796993 RepID=A0A142F1Q6_9CAUD|nr:DNA binding protein [Bacillus phage Mgbh1]AMQ66713.1 single-stranded DNA binding-like protein [Bacillus phage Mgbh1]